MSKTFLLSATAILMWATPAFAVDGGAGNVAPAPDKVVESPPAPADTIVSAPIVIAPHRAIYDMQLGSVHNGGNVASVSGRMLFEWTDVCDGWAIQQHMKLHFVYAEGNESDVTSTELTWEAKDGSAYNFNIHRVTDGKDVEDFRGKASITPDGGTVEYSVPSHKTMKLPAGALFPSSHTTTILREAATGDHLFSRRVFDGTDEDGSDDVSVFIDPPQAHFLDTDLKPELKNNPLLASPAWPVRMAFFKIDTETGEPDYEMDLALEPNGVAKSMRIDYGDFSVNGTLTALEPLPAPHC